jgi:hypothetical protein
MTAPGGEQGLPQMLYEAVKEYGMWKGKALSPGATIKKQNIVHKKGCSEGRPNAHNMPEAITTSMPRLSYFWYLLPIPPTRMPPSIFFPSKENCSPGNITPLIPPVIGN